MKRLLYFTGMMGLAMLLLLASCTKDDNDDDNSGNNTTPPPPENQAPNAPSSPVPADGATGQALQLSLTWTCSDPDQDALTYDVYFGTINPPVTKVLDDVTINTYNTGQLEENKTYYWWIGATDNEGLTTGGPVWSFTTLLPTFQCGDDVTDARDGKIYPTAQFGNLCWMTRNLDYGTMIPTSQAQANNGVDEKYCYGDDPANCTTYGALYQWKELMQDFSKGTELCPDGWHAATFDDWKDLEISLGISAQDAGLQSGWVGTDQGLTLQNATGFNALLGGYISNAGASTGLGSSVRIWTGTEENSFNAFSRELQSSDNRIRHDKWNKDYGYYVRCVENP